MWIILVYLTLFFNGVYGFWNNGNLCPITCACRLQHISETAIYRFMKDDTEKDQHHSEAHVYNNNEVLYDEDFDTPYDEDTSMLRSATCILQTETNIEKLLESLPKDMDSLTLIQGSDSGNKTIKFSHLLEFEELTILELQGPQKKNHNGSLLCEIDVTLPLLEHMNLERVLLKSTLKRFAIIENEINDEYVTFEYEHKVNTNSRPLAFVKKGAPGEILPYDKYLEEKNNVPLFKGFGALILLRISDCELNSVYWEMFEGLNNLIYLLLEKNNLKIIPDFVFYGTPNLKTLSLAWNNLLNIQIANLAGLLELEYLDLSYNNFSQLSELSLPPFPKLKLANFGDNPISVVFPNTFEVMNTTDSLILGGDTQLSLMTNSFLGLKLLKKLTVRNLKIPYLKKDILVGMPNLNELILTGDIPKIEFDAFLEVFNLEKLYISRCNISSLSVDSFMGLNKLKILDLSRNNLDILPLGIFDVLTNLREIYLNDNKFAELTKGMFVKVPLRLIRLNNNPWHCSCEMSDWKPILTNRIKQRTINICDKRHDKGVGCAKNNGYSYKYVYENKVAPKCVSPNKFENWSIFHVMRTQLRCVDFKPKIKKTLHKFKKPQDTKRINHVNNTQTINDEKVSIDSNQSLNYSDVKSSNESTDIFAAKLLKRKQYEQKFNEKLRKFLNKSDSNDESNNLNVSAMKKSSYETNEQGDMHISHDISTNESKFNNVATKPRKIQRRKYRKRKQVITNN